MSISLDRRPKIIYPFGVFYTSTESKLCTEFEIEKRQCSSKLPLSVCVSSIVVVHFTAAGNFEHHIDLRTFYRYRSDFSRRNVCLEVKTTDSDESRLNKKDDINLRKKGVTALRKT